MCYLCVLAVRQAKKPVLFGVKSQVPIVMRPYSLQNHRASLLYFPIRNGPICCWGLGVMRIFYVTFDFCPPPVCALNHIV